MAAVGVAMRDPVRLSDIDRCGPATVTTLLRLKRCIRCSHARCYRHTDPRTECHSASLAIARQSCAGIRTSGSLFAADGSSDADRRPMATMHAAVVT